MARFVTVLAMGSNDWHRTMTLMPTTPADQADAEVRGVRLMLTRQQFASCFEATKFIRQSRRRFREIETFLGGLADDVRRELAKRGGRRPTHGRVPGLARASPQRHGALPGTRPGGARARRRAAGERPRSRRRLPRRRRAPGSDKTLRFHYADTVAVNLLPDVTANPTAIKELATALIAMSRFVGAAFVAYAQAHPEAFSLEP